MTKIPLQPLEVRALFPAMRAELLAILEGLSEAEWAAPTACEGWSVRDVALHLLGDDLGYLSGLRDQDGQWADIQDWASLVAFINAQNDLWVRASRRLSRRLLISLLDFAGQQVHEHLATLDPQQIFGAIGWTGNDDDPMWLHIAREYTERWLHHQHISEAVGKTSLKAPLFMIPIFCTFVYALPQAYRHTDAPLDTLVKVVLSGAGEWHLVKEAATWQLYADTDLTPASTVILEADTAWRMFTKGLAPEVVKEQAIIEGDRALGEIALSAVAIIA